MAPRLALSKIKFINDMLKSNELAISQIPSAAECSKRSVPTPSPQAPQLSEMSSPAGSPPLLPFQGLNLVDGIMIPDLPLDKAVMEYADWQISRVDTQTCKDNIKKACDIALTDGLDLKQIHTDQDPNFFINQGVIVGVARRFVEEI